jgi:hypothetical protein
LAAITCRAANVPPMRRERKGGARLNHPEPGDTERYINQAGCRCLSEAGFGQLSCDIMILAGK